MSHSAHALLIINGKSAGNDQLRQLVMDEREKGITLSVRVTWEKGDAERYVTEAFSLNVDTIIAGGGDGTVNEVAAALYKFPAQKRPVMAVLPLGTANDFATACHIPPELPAALQLALKGKSYPIDLVSVNQEQFFINMATGGFGTKITTETPEGLKALLGGFSYFLHGLSRFNSIKPEACSLHAPDFDWSGEMLVIGIGNGCMAGGGQPLCPDAKINDGLLQIRLLNAVEILPALTATLFSGEQNPNVIEAKVPWVDIKSEDEMTLNLDGEPVSGNEFHIKVLPGEIALRLPENCPMLIK